jgi:hypothetical protein
MWKYRVTAVQPDGTYSWNHSVTVKEARGAWTVSYLKDDPSGRVTLVQTLEQGTMILRKESLTHFPKPDRPWPITLTLDFTDDKMVGTSNRTNGQDTPVATTLGGPVFADEAGAMVTIGCLPLAGGYSTAFRNYDFQKSRERLWQLKVVGQERVTVPAGTFDSYEVELTSADGGPDKELVWVAKDSRVPVRGLTDILAGRNGGSDVRASTAQRGDHIFGMWELVD